MPKKNDDAIIEVCKNFLKVYLTVNLIFYIIAGIFVLSLKVFYSNCNSTDILFVLYPVTKLVEIFWGIGFYFENLMGYCSYDYSIVIGKGCSGINFYIILFSMLMFSFIGHFKRIITKIAGFLFFILVSYVLTIVVNFFRITGSIFIIRSGYFTGIDKDALHMGTGVLFYFFFLSIFYFIAVKLFQKEGVTIGKTS